ncbi:hypothetical protein MCHIJ_43330 [Mycolicibacterium chitae]|uniref:Uncharacterized protein n=1 Tax=Mycolicibacterium chitae TaxID=1792 RepID=A0A3S4RHQ9_MYCCI|nr:hypothetical protein [Mycolicibacterium chitae]MCV7104226.1 hypothetical protein [Mycolicibacterium chitae]BBZ04896.1 hypothetical protein MCHIJ_43330 [Mycolicibacterium chitae]VEG48518.1 Uncharacterised protein [Mycolicibacterium chitae]
MDTDMNAKSLVIAATAAGFLFGVPPIASAIPGQGPEPGSACRLVEGTDARPTGDAFYRLAKQLQDQYGIGEKEAVGLIDSAVSSVYDGSNFMCSEN